MRVVLANVGAHIASPPSPPLGVMSLAGWARQRLAGHTYQIIDQRIEKFTYEEMTRAICKADPDVLAISYMTPASSFVPQMIRNIRLEFPKIKMILGGPHPSAAEGLALAATEADALVKGEGEISFEMFLERVADGSSFDDIPGLYHRDAEGSVILNPGSTPTVEVLDDIPFLAYDLIDLPKYWPEWSQTVLPPPRKYISLFTSRGCPYRCIYCHDVFGKTFNPQSAPRMVEELEYFAKKYNIRDIDFLDDIWNLDKKRVFEFQDLVKRKNLNLRITMANGIRTDILTQEVVDAMVDSGVYVSGFALESGSKRIQKLIKKNLNIEKFLAGVEMFAKKKVFTFGLNIFGFPSETEDEMMQTIQTSTDSMLHVAYYFLATPYPGTGLYKAAEEICPDRLAQVSFSDHNYSRESIINMSSVDNAVLESMTRRAVWSFYSKPSRLYRIFRDSSYKFTPGGTIPIIAISQALPSISDSIRRKRRTDFEGHEASA